MRRTCTLGGDYKDGPAYVRRELERSLCWCERRLWLEPIATSGIDPGAIGGGQIGYNFQHGNIVFGMETDFQGSGISTAAA